MTITGNDQTSLILHLPKFLRKSFQRYSSCFILRLSFDIHLDNIFIYLCVEDIICLRRVNKAFFLLTHEPVIWKRFLPYIKVPIPPLRPTFRYSLQSTDFEVEQLVTRAISLQDNWRRTYPSITSSTLLTTHYKVLDLKLLPGGKYLIASVKDAYSYRFFIIVYHLDHPKGPQALARVPTQAKAYHLQAKYLQYKGEQGIMTAYVRRTFKEGGPLNIDPSDWSFRTEIDPPHPLTHELLCLHIKLQSLEALADPEIRPRSKEYINLAKKQPPPFMDIATLVAPFPMDNLTLFELNDLPYLSVVQQPNKVVTIDLTAGTYATLICNDHEDYIGQPHTIKAIRMLPCQQDMVIIRTIQLSPKDESNVQAHVVEVYEVPSTPGDWSYRNAVDRYFIHGTLVTNFHISDYGIPTSTGDESYLYVDHEPPPPISIYMETTEPVGVIHHIIWPTPITIPGTSTRPSVTKYFYNLDHVCWQTQHVSAPLATLVLPGAYRSLMYTVMTDDRRDARSMITLRRYVNPEFQKTSYPVPRGDMSTNILRKRHPPVPARIYCSLPLDEGGQQLYQNSGLAAITWDEGIGRVCLASEREEQIQILDFAHVVHPDARFARWKRNQEIVMQGS